MHTSADEPVAGAPRRVPGIRMGRRAQFAHRLPLERGRDAINASETDCLAGVAGLEPANPSASYLIGIACQLRLA
jgi:hypothetical protein